MPMTEAEFERDYKILATPVDELTNEQIKRRTEMLREECIRQMQICSERQPIN